MSREAWERLRQDNSLVAGILHDGGTPEDCCVALAHACELLANKAMHYRSIAPRKWRRPDGIVQIWRCPDEWVPETDLSDIGITTN